MKQLLNSVWKTFIHYYLWIFCSVPFSFFGLYTAYEKIKPNVVYQLALQRRTAVLTLFQNSNSVHNVISGKPGSGKSLFESILARSLSGTSYVSFPINDERIHPLLWGNIDLNDPHHFLLPSHSNLFFDEIGTFGNWSDPKNANKQFPGVLNYLKFARHFQHRCFFANQRLGGGVWIEIRELTDLFVETLGLTKYPNFSTLKLRISNNEEMSNSTTYSILIEKADFQAYESRWMEPLIRIKNEWLKRTDSKLVPSFLVAK